MRQAAGVIAVRPAVALAFAVLAIGVLAFSIWNQTPRRTFAPDHGSGSGKGPAATGSPSDVMKGALSDMTFEAPAGGAAASREGTAPPASVLFRSIATNDDLAGTLDRFQEAVADKVRALKPAKPLPATADVAPAARAALAKWLADTSARSMAVAIGPDGLDTDRVTVNADSPFPAGMGPTGKPGPRKPFTATPGITAPPSGEEPDKKQMFIAAAPAPGEGGPPAPGARVVHANVPAHPKDAKGGSEVQLSVMLTYDEKTRQWTAGPVAVAGDPESLKGAMQKIRSNK